MLSATTLSYRNPLWKSAVRPVTLADLRPPTHNHADRASPARATRHLRAVLRFHGIGITRASQLTPRAIAEGLKLPRPCWDAVAAVLTSRWPKDVDRPLLGPAVLRQATVAPELLAVPSWNGKLGETWDRAAPRLLPILARLVALVGAIDRAIDQQQAPTPCVDPGASQGLYAPSPQGAVPPPADHAEPPPSTPSGGAPSPATDASHATGPLERALARSRARRTKPAP
jgi:hypothetical protein